MYELMSPSEEHRGVGDCCHPHSAQEDAGTEAPSERQKVTQPCGMQVSQARPGLLALSPFPPASGGLMVTGRMAGSWAT